MIANELAEQCVHKYFIRKPHEDFSESLDRYHHMVRICTIFFREMLMDQKTIVEIEQHFLNFCNRRQLNPTIIDLTRD